MPNVGAFFANVRFRAPRAISGERLGSGFATPWGFGINPEAFAVR